LKLKLLKKEEADSLKQCACPSWKLTRELEMIEQKTDRMCWYGGFAAL